MNSEVIEKRKGFIINIAFVVLVCAVLYVGIVKALPLVMPFFIAFLIAAIINRPSNKIHNRFPKISKGLAGGVLFTLIALVLIGVLVLAGMQIAEYVKSFFKWLGANVKNLPSYLESFRGSLLKTVEHWPEGLRKSVESLIQKHMSADSIKSINVSGILTGALGGVWDVAKNIPSIALATIIAIISTYFMFGSYDNVLLFFRAQLNEKHRGLVSDVKSAFKDTIGKYAVAYLKIIVITFLELMGYLFLMKITGIYDGKYIPLIALGIALVDILPVLGTGSIVAPWAIISFIQKKFVFGVALIVMWILISIVRQYIEPKLVGKQIGLNPLVTLFGMYVGLKLFGALGMFLVPITVIILKALQDTGKIKIWNSPKILQKESGEIKKEASNPPETKEG